MQHQLSRKDAWNMHLVIDRKFMSKFDTGEQDVEGVERKFLSYLRKHKPYVRRTKGESVAFEEFRRSFAALLSPCTEHFYSSKLIHRAYATLVTFSDASNATGLIEGGRCKKEDRLTTIINKWQDKCNAFEAEVFEYIEFEKLIELLLIQAFNTLMAYERKEQRERESMRDLAESSRKPALNRRRSRNGVPILKRTSSAPSKQQAALAKARAMKKRRRRPSVLSKKSLEEEELEKKYTVDVEEDTVKADDAAAMMTVFQCGGYLPKVYHRWLSAFRFSRVDLDRFFDETLRTVLHAIRMHRASRYMLFKFLRFLISFCEGPKMWMDLARETRNQYVKYRRSRRTRMTETQAAIMVQAAWRGIKLRKKYKHTSKVVEQNERWHVNRRGRRATKGLGIGENLEVHYWIRQLFTVVTDQASLSDEDFDKMVATPPVDFVLDQYTHDLWRRVGAASADTPLQPGNFGDVLSVVVDDMYNRIDTTRQGFIPIDESHWLVEYLMGFRDQRRQAKARDWLPDQGSGRVQKFYVVTFIKKFWLAVLQKKDVRLHKAFLGRVGALLAVDSISQLIPSQSDALAKRRARSTSTGISASLSMGSIIEEKLSKKFDDNAAAEKKRRMTLMVISQLGSGASARSKGSEREPHEEVNPWQNPPMIGANRHRHAQERETSKAKKDAAKMLLSSQFLEEQTTWDTFERWNGQKPASAATSRSIQSRTAKKAARAAQPRPKSAQLLQSAYGLPVPSLSARSKRRVTSSRRTGSGGAGPQSTVLGGLSMRDLRSVVAQVRRTVTAEDNVAEPAIPVSSKPTGGRPTSQRNSSRDRPKSKTSSAKASARQAKSSRRRPAQVSARLYSAEPKPYSAVRGSAKAGPADGPPSEYQAAAPGPEKKENLRYLHKLAKPRKRVVPPRPHEVMDQLLKRTSKSVKNVKGLPEDVEKRLTRNPRTEPRKAKGTLARYEDGLECTFAPRVCAGTHKIVKGMRKTLKERIAKNIEAYVERRQNPREDPVLVEKPFAPKLNSHVNDKVTEGKGFHERLKSDIEARRENKKKIAKGARRLHKPELNETSISMVKDKFLTRLQADSDARERKQKARSDSAHRYPFQPELVGRRKHPGGTFKSRMLADMEKRKEREQKIEQELKKKHPVRKIVRKAVDRGVHKVAKSPPRGGDGGDA